MLEPVSIAILGAVVVIVSNPFMWLARPQVYYAIQIANWPKIHEPLWSSVAQRTLSLRPVCTL